MRLEVEDEMKEGELTSSQCHMTAPEREENLEKTIGFYFKNCSYPFLVRLGNDRLF